MTTPTAVNVRCPECGTMVGEAYGIDGYKHLINCFRLPNEGTAQLYKRFVDDHSERGRRIIYLLEAWLHRGGA